MKLLKNIILLSLVSVTASQALAQDEKRALQTIQSAGDSSLCLGVDPKTKTYEGAELQLQQCSKRESGAIFSGGLQNWLLFADMYKPALMQFMPPLLPAGEGFCIDSAVQLGKPVKLTSCDKTKVMYLFNTISPQPFMSGAMVLEAASLAAGAKVTWAKEVLGKNTQKWLRAAAPV
jgi:hypothetical protein